MAANCLKSCLVKKVNILQCLIIKVIIDFTNLMEMIIIHQLVVIKYMEIVFLHFQVFLKEDAFMKWGENFILIF